MELSQDQINEVVARTIDALRTESGIPSQNALSQQAKMSLYTVQKLLSGKQAIKIPQFLQLVAPMDFTAEEAMERIEAAIRREQARMSAGVHSLDDLRAKKQQQAREMTPEQLDAILEKAGINDTELEQDEPDTP